MKLFLIFIALLATTAQGSNNSNVKYQITVKTGDFNNAGTHADVFVQFFGLENKTEEFELDTMFRDDFERRQTDHFTKYGPNIGEIYIAKIRISKFNNGIHKVQNSWFLESLSLQVDNKKTYFFSVHEWLGKDMSKKIKSETDIEIAVISQIGVKYLLFLSGNLLISKLCNHRSNDRPSPFNSKIKCNRF